MDFYINFTLRQWTGRVVRARIIFFLTTTGGRRGARHRAAPYQPRWSRPCPSLFSAYQSAVGVAASARSVPAAKMSVYALATGAAPTGLSSVHQLAHAYIIIRACAHLHNGASARPKTPSAVVEPICRLFPATERSFIFYKRCVHSRQPTQNPETRKW